MVTGVLSVYGGDGSKAPRKSARLSSIYGPDHSGKPTVQRDTMAGLRHSVPDAGSGRQASSVSSSGHLPVGNHIC